LLSESPLFTVYVWPPDAGAVVDCPDVTSEKSAVGRDEDVEPALLVVSEKSGLAPVLPGASLPGLSPKIGESFLSKIPINPSLKWEIP
jgi:hypothetical protein